MIDLPNCLCGAPAKLVTTKTIRWGDVHRVQCSTDDFDADVECKMQPETGSYSTAKAAVREYLKERVLCVARGSNTRKSAKEELDAFTRLEPGWDGYDGRPLNKPSRELAERFIEANAYLGEPKCVPCPMGGVQLEWHSDQYDIELYVLEKQNAK